MGRVTFRPPAPAICGLRPVDPIPPCTSAEPAAVAVPTLSRSPASAASKSVCSVGWHFSPFAVVAMSSDASRSGLRGRRRECEQLDRVLADLRSGHSQVLVLSGEAGVGKTALLGYLADGASGCRVARAAGVESEMELAFAGLHQLCAPLLDRLDRLPDPQRSALATAFGLQSGDAPERFLVGLAVLSLLSEAAEDQPLVCVIDDAQWLDRASTHALAFVGRRLQAESVALVIAERDPGLEDWERLPRLSVQGLAASDSRALLDSVVNGPLDRRVRERIIAETRGNPLALLELPRGQTPDELAGGFGVPESTPLAGRIEESFRRRLEPLPPSTRLLLLIAAADPVGDPVLVWRAADELGIDLDAATAATAAGLWDMGAQVRFRHPLVRSAVYRDASPSERRNIHRVLASVTDPDVDPDRRAWHRAQGTAGMDEEVAAELESSAGRARARGGLSAAAAFLARAAELTPTPSARALRALAAAQAKHLAGAPSAAQELLAIALAGPLDEFGRARAQLLHAQITFSTTRGREAPGLLLAAAERLKPLDAELARETYLDAFAAAISAGRLASDVGVTDVAAAVLAAGRTAGENVRDLLLDGLALLMTQGYVVAAPTLKRALRACRDEPMAEEDALRWLWLACRLARAFADDESWDALSGRQLQVARRTGALSQLPMALAERFSVELFAGHLQVAESLIGEAYTLLEATGSGLRPQGSLTLAMWRGREAESLAIVDAAQQDVVRRGEGLWLIATHWTIAILYLGLGRYEDALAAADRAAEQPQEFGLSTWVWPELIEAAVRSGHPERAAVPLEHLGEFARATGTDWALGIEARCRALLTDGSAAEAAYREALDRLERTRVRVAVARARLLFGEWLRREGRRIDAREQLRSANEMFVEIGMDAFAERARKELVATGETARKRTVETLGDLTPQEAQIARLAADRRTNPEIGALLFLSPRTVEWHLRKVFSKLGVSSRRELIKALANTAA
jgi:DNA-binding CsgD family transcriptional regulator